MRPAVLHGINGLRAISCLMIAGFHTSQHLVANAREIWFPFKQTPGIHIFLVICGFMLASSAHADDSPMRFILKRLGRIVPLYWLLTAFTIALTLWRPWLFPAADITAADIVASVLFFPEYDRGGLIEPILFVGWTLNYIVLTYALFALTTVAPHRARPFIAIALLLAVMVLAQLLPPGAARTFWSGWLQLDIAAGLLVGALLRGERVARLVRTHAMWPIIATGAFALVITALSDLDGMPRVIACGASAAVVVFGLAGQDMHRTPLPDNPLSWLGRISYGIYLIHPLIIPIVGVVVIGKIGPSGLESAIVFVAVIWLTIIAAKTSHRFIELPASNWVHGHLPGLKRADEDDPALQEKRTA